MDTVDDQVLDTVDDEIGDDDELEVDETGDVDENDDIDAEEGDDEDGAGDDEDQEDDLEEVEIDGVKYSIPSKLKDNLLMHSDYTKKTQDVAEQRRAHAAEVEAHQKEQALYKQHQEKYAELHALNAQIKQYETVDWTTLRAQNPDLAQQHQFNFVNLKNEAQQKAQELEKLQTEAEEAQQGNIARRKQEVRSRLASEIEGWSGERAKAVAETAQKLGFTPQFLKAINDAVFPDTVAMVKALNQVALYNEMLEKAAKAGKGKTGKKVKVTKKVTGKKTSKKSIYDKSMSTEERIKLRNKQRAAKRARDRK